MNADSPVAAGSGPKLPPLLVDEREARRLLGNLCARTMYNLRRSGKLRGLKIGSRVLYSMDELRAFVSRQKGVDA